MGCPRESDMAFARTMSDYGIDSSSSNKDDEFWQFSDGTEHQHQQQHHQHHQHQHHHHHHGSIVPSSSDFVDQFVMMEMDGGSNDLDLSVHSPGDSLFMDAAGLVSSSSAAAVEEEEQEGSSSCSPSFTSPRRQSQTAPRQEAIDRFRTGLAGAGPTNNNHVVLGHLNAETLEQRRRLLSGRRGTMLGEGQAAGLAGASISDSELLRLEGLSVHSPRGLMSRIVPSAGDGNDCTLLSSSSSSSTSSSSLSAATHRVVPVVPSADDIDLCNLAKTGGRSHHFPKASTRKFESIFSTVRRAVGGRGRIQQQQQQPQQQPQPSSVHMESAKKATRRLAAESDMMWNGLPISPPLTNDGNNATHSNNNNNNNAFVSGLMDDPFFDASSVAYHGHGALLGPAAHINGKSVAFNANLSIPNTPLATPIIKQEEGDHATRNNCNHNNNNYFPATTTAAADSWNLHNGTSFTAPPSTLSSTSPFFSGVENSSIDAWSFDPSSSDFTTSSSVPHPNHQDGSANPRNHHNLTINLPPYALAHSNSPHPSPGHTDDLAVGGLMIHMPQPRTPNPNIFASFPPDHHTHAAANNNNNNQLHLPFHPAYTTTAAAPENHSASSARRPKPRAPSSGARYHQQQLSPRKIRQTTSASTTPSPTPGIVMPGSGGSGTRRRSRSRQASLSRFPGPGHHAPPMVVGHRRSTTDLTGEQQQQHAIRKRRSTSSWRGSALRRSGSAGDPSSAGGGVGGGISFEGVGFVNYTPDDHNVLMTGVAPSGSSKTKMRREKEAAERERKLSEAVMAAGLDVSMLKDGALVA